LQNPDRVVRIKMNRYPRAGLKSAIGSMTGLGVGDLSTRVVRPTIPPTMFILREIIDAWLRI